MYWQRIFEMDDVIIKLQKQLISHWATRGSTSDEVLRNLMHPNISGFGGGLHEGYENRDGVLNIRDNEMAEVDQSPSLDIQWIKSKVYDQAAVCWCQLDIKFPGDQGFFIIPNMRMSTTWIKEENEWRAVHSHFSKADTTIEEGDAFPLEQLRDRNIELEQLIDEKTQSLIEEKEKTESLLHNILPVEIAKELLETGTTKPRRFEEVSILFSDFQGFTNIVATIPTRKLISELNEIFSHFDDIMDEEGIEKIQTIGDAYLAACGLPAEVDDHAIRCVRAARKMLDYLNDRNQKNAIKWKMRIGIHSGPIAAGVVGKRKFSYDIFGDTINIASRIETSGEEGKINISAYTYDLVKDHFECEYRGKIGAKGKGDLDMYFIKEQ